MMPILTLWAKFGVIESCFNALDLWRQRAHQVKGQALDSTHYMAEEIPQEITMHMLEFFSQNPIHKKEISQ